MTDILDLHKYFLSGHLKKGGACADFTMGNGHDTKFLSEAVYESEEKPGHVYAFDIQPAALLSTEKLLKESGCHENYELILDSHEFAANYIHEPLCAGVFNLGWLPGAGDKSVTTRCSSTIPAIESALSLLDSNGILLVAVYPGHEEGEKEGKAVYDLLSSLERHTYGVYHVKIANSPRAPFFFAVEKK